MAVTFVYGLQILLAILLTTVNFTIVAAPPLVFLGASTLSPAAIAATGALTPFGAGALTLSSGQVGASLALAAAGAKKIVDYVNCNLLWELPYLHNKGMYVNTEDFNKFPSVGMNDSDKDGNPLKCLLHEAFTPLDVCYAVVGEPQCPVKPPVKFPDFSEMGFNGIWTWIAWKNHPRLLAKIEFLETIFTRGPWNFIGYAHYCYRLIDFYAFDYLGDEGYEKYVWVVRFVLLPIALLIGLAPTIYFGSQLVFEESREALYKYYFPDATRPPPTIKMMVLRVFIFILEIYVWFFKKIFWSIPYILSWVPSVIYFISCLFQVSRLFSGFFPSIIWNVVSTIYGWVYWAATKVFYKLFPNWFMSGSPELTRKLTVFGKLLDAALTVPAFAEKAKPALIHRALLHFSKSASAGLLKKSWWTVDCNRLRVASIDFAVLPEFRHVSFSLRVISPDEVEVKLQAANEESAVARWKITRFAFFFFEREWVLGESESFEKMIFPAPTDLSDEEKPLMADFGLNAEFLANIATQGVVIVSNKNDTTRAPSPKPKPVDNRNAAASPPSPAANAAGAGNSNQQREKKKAAKEVTTPVPAVIPAYDQVATSFSNLLGGTMNYHRKRNTEQPWSLEVENVMKRNCGVWLELLKQNKNKVNDDNGNVWLVLSNVGGTEKIHECLRNFNLCILIAANGIDVANTANVATLQLQAEIRDVTNVGKSNTFTMNILDFGFINVGSKAANGTRANMGRANKPAGKKSAGSAPAPAAPAPVASGKSAAPAAKAITAPGASNDDENVESLVGDDEEEAMVGEYDPDKICYINAPLRFIIHYCRRLKNRFSCSVLSSEIRFFANDANTLEQHIGKFASIAGVDLATPMPRDASLVLVDFLSRCPVFRIKVSGASSVFYLSHFLQVDRDIKRRALPRESTIRGAMLFTTPPGHWDTVMINKHSKNGKLILHRGNASTEAFSDWKTLGNHGKLVFICEMELPLLGFSSETLVCSKCNKNANDHQFGYVVRRCGGKNCGKVLIGLCTGETDMNAALSASLLGMTPTSDQYYRCESCAVSDPVRVLKRTRNETAPAPTPAAAPAPAPSVAHAENSEKKRSFKEAVASKVSLKKNDTTQTPAGLLNSILAEKPSTTVVGPSNKSAVAADAPVLKNAVSPAEPSSSKKKAAAGAATSKSPSAAEAPAAAPSKKPAGTANTPTLNNAVAPAKVSSSEKKAAAGAAPQKSSTSTREAVATKKDAAAPPKPAKKAAASAAPAAAAAPAAEQAQQQKTLHGAVAAGVKRTERPAATTAEIHQIVGDSIVGGGQQQQQQQQQASKNKNSKRQSNAAEINDEVARALKERPGFFLDPNTDQEGMDEPIENGLGLINAETRAFLGEGFQASWPNAPHPASIMGSHVLKWELAEKVLHLAQGTKSQMTFKLHLRFLHELQRMLRHSDKDWHRAPLVVIAIQMLLVNNKVRNWLPQTLFRNACALQGALGALPLYTNQKEMQLQLGLEPLWKAMMSKWRLEANQAQPHNQEIATFERINAALANVELNDLRTMAAILLQWYMAGRVGDVLNLKWKDFIIEDKEMDFVRFKITVSEGKVIAKRGPYTVATKIPQQHARLILSYFRTAPHLGDNIAPSTRIFPTSKHSPGGMAHSHQQKLMRLALKKVHPKLCTRAIRRGALQAMADEGVEHETLMVFSGHTEVKTLLRYLNWGRNAGNQSEKAQQAAEFLQTRQQTTRLPMLEVSSQN